MPFPTFVRGYFQKGKKEYEKKKSVQILIQLPHFTIFVCRKHAGYGIFGKTSKNRISGKGCPECSQCCLSILLEMQEGRQASVSVQKGKSLMFSIALIVELVIIC